MASEQSPEAKELALVGKVEMRIALASSEKKLEELLNIYLTPLLLKLGSDSVAVRNKVISICQHINTRITSQDIKLPVAALLKQYKENADISLIRHFDILYIQQGISRLTVAERLDLLPVLLKGISNDYEKSQQHASQLFHLILRLLVLFKLPLRGSKEDDELRVTLGLSDHDAAFLSKWFGKLILLGIVKETAPQSSALQRCPGLSPDDYKFLTLQGKPDAWDPTADAGLSLTESKALVARFVASGLFNQDEKFLPALFASADTNSRISEVGEDTLKRVMLSKDLEQSEAVEALLGLYFGSSTVHGSLPVKTPLRIRILNVLSKSVRCTAYPQQIARIVEEGLLSPELNATNKAAGREASKFRSAIFSLVNFVARHGASSNLSQVAQSLVDNLRAFIQDQGWPTPDRDQDMELRGYGYVTIGLLAKAAPEKILLEPNLDLLEFLFRSLREDSAGKEVAVSIEEALSSVLGAFSKPFDASIMHRFRQILLRYATVDQHNTPASDRFTRSTRYVATRFANRCLPYEDVLARWIDILAVSGGAAERHEIVEEGRRGLDPYWFKMSNTPPGERDQSKLIFPDFDKLVNFIIIQQAQDEDAMDIDKSEDALLQVQDFYQQYPGALSTVISFCSSVAMQSALVDKDMGDDAPENWERKLDTQMTTDMRARQAFRAYAANESHGRSLAVILRASFDRLTRDDVSDIGDIGTTFVRLLSLLPQRYWVLANVVRDFRALQPSIVSNNPARRLAAAHAYGLLASHKEIDQNALQSAQVGFFDKLQHWESAIGADINQISGVILALGYYHSRAFWRASATPATIADDHPINKLLHAVVEIMKNSRDATLKSAAFSCIDQLSLFYVITPLLLSKHGKAEAVVQQIYDSAKSGTTSAILALGHLSMITEEDESHSEEASDYKTISDKLYELHEVRQPEVHFSVGEALSCFAAGWESKALTAELDILHPDQPQEPWDAPLQAPLGPKREKTLGIVMEKTLKGCLQTKPSLKKASVIWLLCLLQYCGHKPDMQSYLSQCQIAFKNCLSDRDEVVQEAASRGLGLVYEKGDRQLKDDLVRDLVGSFSDNKSKMAGTVTDDTQLFEPGALPTGDGSITTYKDILNLAAEVGDSSLVYRFMSMASNNSIWSSRAAFGRFGLSNIFSDSSVDGYLAQNPKLYPKLYRYRFDPNPNVQRSMNDIWNALVKDSSATIDKHFDAIMDDLLISILTKEWRVRQASCAAIADLVQGRSIDKYEKYPDAIWGKTFKVLDDIKETVRVAAASLARVLTGILTRSLEAGDASNKSATIQLERVIPFLFSQSGLESSAEEVRLFSVHTLLQIVKKSNANTLNPHVPELVERLLGLLSSLEPEAVNYVHLNASKYNLTEQKIDDMRLASVRSSPLTESVERCLDLADEETMSALVPRIEAAMKNAVGLPSKVGCSRILVTLATRHRFVFNPYADSFLKLVQKQIHDRNETVSSSYAAAAGYLARLASDKQLLSTFAFVNKMYFESEESSDRNRLLAADIMRAMSLYATDRFTSFQAEFLPFIFLAKHDSEEQVRKSFTETWDDHVAGPRTVSLYLKEIIVLSERHLESRQWAIKHTAAKTVADCVLQITNAVGSENIDIVNAKVVWPVLDKALSGKSWEGKEVVLEAFVRFVERSEAYWKNGEDKDIAKQLEKVANRESKRQEGKNEKLVASVLEKLRSHLGI
ncbi:major component of the proteasome [Pyrenophora tritici-repentis]|uniref:Major component of the proteasome n=2 Tax=Pyrenophora tritici-repentis TaxID=45151 RepID=A0A2W1EVZ1_9PLEO|nr:major component of the proteasome [Pyrenophora tritici-repentis Pt-1C-BFP]KAA8627351.1 Major component of the proteasome [Pyrenophora tritici-repentis]EDU41831.1 major component of the proteasome [Pyrenophora tritici-repentis Pt-1C-BFP]KAF7442624.1 Major component of the proteasome [Pyrenophora tritici-repentis]KAF7579001.1 major component proteasome [Pyrenophora tritici-repentis]KAG9377935.1 Major component of the proteasome [Pyrenophora tritici-repentis]